MVFFWEYRNDALGITGLMFPRTIRFSELRSIIGIKLILIILKGTLTSDIFTNIKIFTAESKSTLKKIHISFDSVTAHKNRSKISS